MAWVGEQKDTVEESGDEKRFDDGLAPSPKKKSSECRNSFCFGSDPLSYKTFL